MKIHKLDSFESIPVSEINKITFELDQSTPHPDNMKKIVESFRLLLNYPNPFNSTTHLAFNLPGAGVVEFSLYDNSGRKLQAGRQYYSAGQHIVSWRADNVPSGAYFIKAAANGVAVTKKLTLVK